MTKKNQPKQKNQKLSETIIFYNNILANYIDIVARGLVAFLTIGLTAYFVFTKWLGTPIWITIPVIFILSVIATPLLSKISFGYLVQNKFEEYLERIIEWRNKFKNENKKT